MFRFTGLLHFVPNISSGIVDFPIRQIKSSCEEDREIISSHIFVQSLLSYKQPLRSFRAAIDPNFCNVILINFSIHLNAYTFEGPNIQTNYTQEQIDFFYFDPQFYRAFVQRFWMDHERKHTELY